MWALGYVSNRTIVLYIEQNTIFHKVDLLHYEVWTKPWHEPALLFPTVDMYLNPLSPPTLEDWMVLPGKNPITSQKKKYIKILPGTVPNCFDPKRHAMPGCCPCRIVLGCYQCNFTSLSLTKIPLKIFTHLNRENIEPNLSVPGFQGHHENALIQELRNEPPLDTPAG